jgi:hypothetical protein
MYTDLRGVVQTPRIADCQPTPAAGFVALFLRNRLETIAATTRRVLAGRHAAGLGLEAK